MRVVVSSAALAAVFLLAPAGMARADEVSRADFQSLVERAKSGGGALEELREVDSVDGQPVDVAGALRGASGRELDGRLDALGDGTGGTGDAAAARARAAKILAAQRFQRSEYPRPLEGVLTWIGRRFQPLWNAFGQARDRVIGWLPGGESTFWVLVAALVIGMTAFVARRLAARRTRTVDRTRRSDRRVTSLDPDHLEREAAAAERSGELELALRLRFRAGLLRLDHADVLPFDPSITSGEVKRLLSSRSFDEVAARFDEIVYGRRPPAAEDLRASRSGWGRVLAEIGKR